MPSVHVDTPVTLIQQVRLIHALSEGGAEIIMSRIDLAKLRLLADRFGLRFREGSRGDLSLRRAATLDHRTPRTTIGALERPLIFPHAIVALLARDWPAARRHRVTFAGLMTRERAPFVRHWVERQLGPEVAGRWQRLNRGSLAGRLLRTVRGGSGSTEFREHGVLIRQTTRGRDFPLKAWDEEYGTLLRNTEFALCPAGDFDWTYRFFEAALSGAIPIVERVAPAYRGFAFHVAAEPLSSLRWSAAAAEQNRALAAERLTIPVEAITAELGRLLQG